MFRQVLPSIFGTAESLAVALRREPKIMKRKQKQRSGSHSGRTLVLQVKSSLQLPDG
jgi:hypothetical protein